ncbi:MAG: aspartate aminotransferase family protein [Firmicutes bacterium]|nr:aspartate aminotransferase family protein [Bacillota bacterium]
MKCGFDLDLLSGYAGAPKNFVKGIGARHYTSDGREFIDFNEMRIVLGQGNEAFKDAMLKALSCDTSDHWSVYEARLYDYLAEKTGGIFDACFLTSSGSESVESAVRVAKKLTGKTELITFWNSIHGRTYLSSCMSGVKKRKVGYGQLAPGIIHVPYPKDMSIETSQKCLDEIKAIYDNGSAHDAAAVFVEPCQGFDNRFASEYFLKGLSDWCKEEGMLLVFDEIQCGMGRTGSYFLYQQLGIEPDILLLGKALGNGLHISAVLMKKAPEFKDRAIFTGGSGNDVLACAAACEVFRQLDAGLLKQVRKRGDCLYEKLSDFRYDPKVAQVRGKGLAAAIEFTDPAVCDRVYLHLTSKNLLVGRSGASIFFKPPYVIEDRDIDILAKALKDALSR